jgi:moderate conductance mechanosensitive channel
MMPSLSISLMMRLRAGERVSAHHQQDGDDRNRQALQKHAELHEAVGPHRILAALDHASNARDERRDDPEHGQNEQDGEKCFHADGLEHKQPPLAPLGITAAKPLPEKRRSDVGKSRHHSTEGAPLARPIFRLRFSAMLLLLFALLSSGTPAAAATAAATPAMTPDQARQILSVLNDPTRRDAFLASLQSVAAEPAKAGPAKAEPAAADTKKDGAAKTVPAKPAAAPVGGSHLVIPLEADSLGAQLLDEASHEVRQIAVQLRGGLGVQEQARALLGWLGVTFRDTWVRQQVPRLIWETALIMACGIAADQAVRWLLIRPRRALLGWAERRLRPNGEPRDRDPAVDPETRKERLAQRLFLRRVRGLAGYLVLEIVPTQAFALTIFILFSIIIPTNQVDRWTLGAIANAYIVTRLIMSVARTFVTPDSAALRPFRLTDAQARGILRWLLRLVVTATAMHALVRICLMFGLPLSAHQALMKLLVLVLHVLALTMIIRERAAITAWIRPRPGATGTGARWRHRFARGWYLVALFYLVAVWVVRALDIPDAVGHVLRIAVVTIVVLSIARFLTLSADGLLGRLAGVLGEDEVSRYPALRDRVQRYETLLRAAVVAVVVIAALFGMLQGWGLDPLGWLTRGPLGGKLASALLNIVVTLALALIVWELANGGLGRRVARLEREGKRSRAARLRTLLPMLRTALVVTIAIVIVFVVLSQIGVNTAPLLAGAGVAGIALGFGSQKLVQDVINGLFLLLEDAVQVGDVVSVAGLTGTVEHLSIRSIRLRSEDGSVHLIPFSAVTSVTNMTRDFAYAVAKLTVSYSEDPDVLMEVLREIVRGMRAEAAWGALIQTDLEVQGLDSFGERGMTISCRIRTNPFSRWGVSREFNRRIQARFAVMGVEMALPHRVIAGEAEAPPVGAQPRPLAAN